MTKVAVILPSRGLMFSQTADEILNNLKGIPHKFFFSHGNPIPDCFENPTQSALSDDTITHLWFVEDDMKLPPSTLKKLLEKDVAVVTADYPVNKNGRGSVFKIGRQVMFTGTGCLLVKRAVFDELKAPYFRTDIKWNIKNMGDYVKFRAVEADDEGYGLHDVNFGLSLYQRGIPIHTIPQKLGQRKLVAFGKAGSNDGAHNIETWTHIEKDHLLKQVKTWPVQEMGNLTTVITPTGEITVSEAHAKTLIRKKLATKAPKRKVVVEGL